MASILRLVFVVVLAATPVCGKDADSVFAERMKATPPCAALVAAALSNNIPLTQLRSSNQTNALRPGDYTTALVTLHEKGKRTNQWVVHLTSVPAEPGELKTNSYAPVVLYSSLGGKLEYTSSPAFAVARTLGPFSAGKSTISKPRDQSARLSLNEGFLGLGLDSAAALIYRVNEPGYKTNLEAGFLSAQWGKAFTPARIAESQKVAEPLHITPQEERSFCSAAPVFFSYFGTIQQTRGLNEILPKLVKLPSAWSLLRPGHGRFNFDGRNDHLDPVDPTVWGLPAGSRVYYLPVDLNLDGHVLVGITLVVTSPRPPLLLCGGIVGMLAEKPGDKETYLTMRVISAGEGSVRLAESTLELPSPVERNPTTQSAWKRIVMVGASASAGFTASEPLGGPTTRQFDLCRYVEAALLVPHEPVQNLATPLFSMQPETTGRYQLAEALKAKATSIIGGDFLFWYCYGEGATDQERLDRFENGLKLLEAVRCPLVLGDIPDASAADKEMLRPDQIPTPRALAAANLRLKQWAAARENVTIVPLAQFMHLALNNKAVSVHGYSLADGKTRALLQPDKLHPSRKGCALLALTILDAFGTKLQAGTANEVCWDPEKVLRTAGRTTDR